MAPHEQPKPRNNARKAAARALQKQNPGMSYMQALAKVTEPAGSAEASTALHIQTLLNIGSAQGIAARHRDTILNMEVPVGISDTGDTATLNIAHAAMHPDGTGPHGTITGPGALDLALSLALALRANNGADRVQVAFAGPEHHCRTAAPVVDQVVPSPWHDWLRTELTRRSEIAQAAQVTNLYNIAEVPSLVTLIAADDGHRGTAEEEATMANAVRIGRSLGVHVILVSPETSIWSRLSAAATGNLSFHVALTNDSGRRVATADTFNTGHFAFSPAQLGGGELAEWITTVRQAP